MKSYIPQGMMKKKLHILMSCFLRGTTKKKLRSLKSCVLRGMAKKKAAQLEISQKQQKKAADAHDEKAKIGGFCY